MHKPHTRVHTCRKVTQSSSFKCSILFLIEALAAPTIKHPPMLDSGQNKRLAQNHNYSTLTSNQAGGVLEAYTEAHLRKHRGPIGKKV